jgi:hypothetical protein
MTAYLLLVMSSEHRAHGLFPERRREAKRPRSQREQRLGEASWRGSLGVVVFEVTNAPAFRPALIP